MLKISISALKRIMQRFVIKGHVNQESWFCSHQSFHKKAQQQALNDCFEGYKKTFVFFLLFCWRTPKIFIKKFFFQIDKIQMDEGTGNFNKNMQKYIFCGQQKFTSNTAILSLRASYIVASPGRPEETLQLDVPLITNLCPILFSAERDFFNIYISKIA